MTDPEPYERGVRVQLDRVPLAVVRRDSITLDDVRDLFDEGYAALGRLLGDGTLVPVGPGLAIYRGDVQARFDLELGFPVTEAPTSRIPCADLEVVGARAPRKTGTGRHPPPHRHVDARHHVTSAKPVARTSCRIPSL